MTVHYDPYDGGKLGRFVEALTLKRDLRARLNSKKAPEFSVDGKAFYGDPSSRPDLRPLRNGQDWDPYLGSLSGKSLGAEARRKIAADTDLQALFMFIEADDDPHRVWLDWFRRAERRPRTTLRE